MSSLKVTDIRKSSCDRVFDVITAIFLNRYDHDCGVQRSLDGSGLLVLESSTAQKEIPRIGVHSGDQYIRMRAKSDHGLSVGEKIWLDGL
ncbi:MAG: hypothetical protein ACP5PV_12305 [Methanothrix sp.]|jgi:hypothetical protein